MILEKEIVGYHRFHGKVDVTDPGYDDDVWCRENGVEIRPGDYECVAWVDDDSKRVMRCGIYFADSFDDEAILPEGEEIAVIGVDAGLAGFFEDKPNYTDEEWQAFCDSILEGHAWIKDEGFFTTSGWGDGAYPVTALRSAQFGDIIGLEITFH